MKTALEDGRFSLVLSGGGALGIAHLGILHDLECRNLCPGEIVGTSMGGIVGACMAVGMNEAAIFEQIRRFSGVFNWLTFSRSGNAMIDNKKIAKLFRALFGNRKMSETDIPLKLIATDLADGTKCVFGPDDDVMMVDAVLATMAIPGIFSEHTINGRVYGDGFLCENLGANEAVLDTVLAVDVLGRNAFSSTLPDNFFKTTNVLEMFERSMRLLTYNQTRTHLEHFDRPVLLIEPDTSAYKTFHFHRSRSIRALGLGLLDAAEADQ